MHLSVGGEPAAPSLPGAKGKCLNTSSRKGGPLLLHFPVCPIRLVRGAWGRPPQGPGWWTDLLLKASSGGERRCFLQLPGMYCCYWETLLAQEVSMALDGSWCASGLVTLWPRLPRGDLAGGRQVRAARGSLQPAGSCTTVSGTGSWGSGSVPSTMMLPSF